MAGPFYDDQDHDRSACAPVALALRPDAPPDVVVALGLARFERVAHTDAFCLWLWRGL